MASHERRSASALNWKPAARSASVVFSGLLKPWYVPPYLWNYQSAPLASIFS